MALISPGYTLDWPRARAPAASNWQPTATVPDGPGDADGREVDGPQQGAGTKDCATGIPDPQRAARATRLVPTLAVAAVTAWLDGTSASRRWEEDAYALSPT